MWYLERYASVFLGPHYYGQMQPIRRGRNHVSPMVFDVVGHNTLGYWFLGKDYANIVNPFQLLVYQPCISQRRENSQTWSDRRLF